MCGAFGVLHMKIHIPIIHCKTHVIHTLLTYNRDVWLTPALLLYRTTYDM